MKLSNRNLFRKDLFRSIASSGVTLTITFLTTPLMTRIFPADAYGINGIMMTSAALITNFGLLGLPVALTREQGTSEYERLLNASAQMAMILTALCAALVFVGIVLTTALFDKIGPAVAILLPIMVLATAIQRVSDSQVTAEGLFRAGAIAKVVNSVVARGLSLGAGIVFQPIAVVMLVSDTIGKASQVLVTARFSGRGQAWFRLRWWPEPRFLWEVIKDYRHFALQANLAAALPLLAALTIQTVLGWRLGLAANGQYILAQSILTLPVSIVALASAPVVFHQLSRIADSDPDHLAGLALRMLLSYLAVGSACMAPFIFFGPSLFALVFGETWREAGSVAAMMAVPQIFAFSLTGILSLFRVTRRLGAWLAFETVGTLTVAGGILIAHSTDLNQVVYQLVAVLLAYQLIMHSGCIWVAIRYGGPKA